MIIAIDFDGTCVTNNFPNMGEDIGAAPVLRELVEAGHKLLLWTVRDRGPLMDARQWFQDNEIQLWAVNHNPDNPTSSPKVHAKIFIDDRALGAPLTGVGKPHLDWYAAREHLVDLGVL